MEEGIVTCQHLLGELDVGRYILASLSGAVDIKEATHHYDE